MARRCISVMYHLLWRRFMGIFLKGRRPKGCISINLQTPAGGSLVPRLSCVNICKGAFTDVCAGEPGDEAKEVVYH